MNTLHRGQWTPKQRTMRYKEAARREKRRLLDAQRGKCRVRLGSHLDEWCALKDHLGFSLHSQLAKFLLDSYRTTTSPGTPVPKAITLLSVSVQTLHRLAFLCHQHGRNCQSPPTILAQPCSTEAPETPLLLWGCKDDHQFHWHPHDCSAGLDDNTDVPDLSPMQQNRTMGPENVPEIPAEVGQVINTENQLSLQRTEIEPYATAVQESLSEKQSRTDASPNMSPDNVNVQPEQSIDSGSITESISEEGLLMIPGNEWPLKTSADKNQEELVTDEGLCQSIGHEILVLSTTEVGETEDEDTSPQGVEVSEDTQESITMEPAKKRPEASTSGRACRYPRAHNQLSQSYQQALMTGPKAALSFPCRRSPRGSKGYHTKIDGTEQVSHSKVQPTSEDNASRDLKGQDIDIPLGLPPNTDLSKKKSHIQESLPEDVTRQKTPFENLEGLTDLVEQKEPQSESGEMSSAMGEEEQNAETETHGNEEWEPQSSQCRGQKTSRRKSLVDEELAQICKKRIRKATPQELLMCEYDDCGKIFSKRQYLNYHQKYQHMNQRTFHCSVMECGKTFNFKKHLKEHEKRHSDRRDFICEFCARAFRSSSNLIIHRRIHTGEKPLQCEFCGFTCRQKASLNWHMKKHDADSFYKFPCDICGQKFEKRDNLAAHKSRKHPAPRETGPQDNSRCIASPMDDACQTEDSRENDLTERLSKNPDQTMAQTTPEGGEETLFPGYLDLSESVQEVSQQGAQTPGNTGISLVIVL
ncbi:zinc finger protein 692-like isoform X2 [Rhinoderma darwinii]|uniref:zinc finger protein 692-like isoform X2 n=1 Tax=Rhinoderma darwinii TaxID=43563 RepID=UPI003F6612FB